MKKVLLLIILFFAAASSQNVYSQFWKKKKDPPSKKRPPVAKPKESSVAPPKKKVREIVFPKSVLKDRYRMDILLPLYLDDLVKNDKPVNKDKLPEKALTGVNFYEGVKLAADTLTKMGYEVDIYVHDITQTDFAPEALIKSNVLAESDLIIGGVQSYHIKPLADYAKKKQINFVSVLSPADANVLDNPYFTIIQPTLITHIKKLRATVLRKYPNQDIHLFYRTNPSVDSAAYQYAFEDKEKNMKRFSVNTFPTQAQLQKLFDSTETNVIMMPIIDEGYSESIIEQLYNWFPQYAFEIYGLPSWKFMDKLRKTDVYPNVAIIFSTPFHFDMSNSGIVPVATNYKNNFGIKMSEMSLRGYEITVWYSYLLKKYGNIFNERMKDNATTFSKYQISPQWTEDNDLMYNENTHYFLYRYQNGSYMVN